MAAILVSCDKDSDRKLGSEANGDIYFANGDYIIDMQGKTVYVPAGSTCNLNIISSGLYKVEKIGDASVMEIRENYHHPATDDEKYKDFKHFNEVFGYKQSIQVAAAQATGSSKYRLHAEQYNGFYVDVTFTNVLDGKILLFNDGDAPIVADGCEIRVPTAKAKAYELIVISDGIESVEMTGGDDKGIEVNQTYGRPAAESEKYRLGEDGLYKQAITFNFKESTEKDYRSFNFRIKTATGTADITFTQPGWGNYSLE